MCSVLGGECELSTLALPDAVRWCFSGVSDVRGRDESVEKVSLAFLKPLSNAHQNVWLPVLFSLTGNLCDC